MKFGLPASPGPGLVLGILSVSTASILIRFAQAGTSSLVIAAGRMGIAALILLPVALCIARREVKMINERTWGLLILAGLFLGLHFATWITSLEYTSVASSVVLVTTAPLWVALLSPLFLKDKLSRGVIAGLVVSLCGSVIVGLNNACHWTVGGISCIAAGDMFSGRAFLGNVLALSGAFLSAGYLMVGRKIRSRVSLLLYTSVVYTFAAIFLLIIIALTQTPLKLNFPSTWIYLLLLALVPQIIGHSTLNYYLKRLSAALVSIALLGEPIGSVILAYFLLKESPTIIEVFGGLLILAGIVIASKSRPVQTPVDAEVAY